METQRNSPDGGAISHQVWPLGTIADLFHVEDFNLLALIEPYLVDIVRSY